MSCRADYADGTVLLVSHHPISVFTTTHEYIERIERKPDGHYDREHLETLAKEGHAVMYDEKAVLAIARANQLLIFGCPPRT